jgi:hypothetical protein
MSVCVYDVAGRPTQTAASPRMGASTEVYAYGDTGRACRPGGGLQEEGEYEYVAYHHGGQPKAKGGGEEAQAHIEAAVLYQPLLTSNSEEEAIAREVVRSCEVTQHESPRVTTCAQEASLWGKIKHAAAGAWHFVKHILAPGPSPSDEIKDKIGSEPPWAEEGAQDLDNWGFDDIEWDWP